LVDWRRKGYVGKAKAMREKVEKRKTVKMKSEKKEASG
jgi:hypothetical protein